jgi:hypothetical protein
MKRLHLMGVLLLIPAMAMVFAVGCDKGGKSPTTGATGATTGADKTGEAGKKVAIKTATDATVEGVVKFDGAFAAEPENRIKDLKEKKDQDGCMAGGGNHVLKQDWIVGKDNGLANVIVSIEPGAGKKYEVADALRDAFKAKKVILDQPYCAFVPHVSAIYAEVQPFVVKNSAKFSHNTNIKPPDGGNTSSSNKTILPGEQIEPEIKKENSPISISCELHPFMGAKLVTFNHPYFAVTDENGHFKIENVHVDEELVVNVWHEVAGKKEFAKKTFTKGNNKLDGIKLSK